MKQTLGAMSFGLMMATSAAAERCAVDTVVVEGGFGAASFTVEVADTNPLRAQGLMHRETMARFAGMLFVYESPRSASFWMRNTLIPLDMLFADDTGTIVSIHENAIPLDETPIFGGQDILVVLEINGGLSSRLGIEPGDVLVHPSLDPARAASPCD